MFVYVYILFLIIVLVVFYCMVWGMEKIIICIGKKMIKLVNDNCLKVVVNYSLVFGLK